MNTTPTDEMILKTDVLGRVKTPLARREQLLDEFERSGLSGQKFAELVGVKYPTFATWAQKAAAATRRLIRGQASAGQPRTIPGDSGWRRWWKRREARDDKNRFVAGVELPGGAQVQISDAKQAALGGGAAAGAAKCHVKFFGQPESVRGGGSLRHAQRVQRAARLW